MAVCFGRAIACYRPCTVHWVNNPAALAFLGWLAVATFLSQAEMAKLLCLTPVSQVPGTLVATTRDEEGGVSEVHLIH